jgi:uncharacterized protein YjeT (DUF2065 family)
MVDYSNELYTWTLNVLFFIGIVLLPVGAGFIFFPDKIFKLANRLNHWVVTDSFFNKLNQPRYKEYHFYRHHRIFGMIIIIVSIVCLYMLTIYAGVENVKGSLIKLAESEFEKWLFVILYYVLISATMLVIIFGTIMFKRPSVLKTFEGWSNHWVDTDSPLKMLDTRKDLPDRILPGNPRIFGIFVILGAIYIIWSTFPL